MNEHVQTATSEPLFNPLSPEFIRNPYPHYERMRTTDPMHVTPFLMTFYRGLLASAIPGVEFGDFINPPLLTVAEIRDLLRQDVGDRPNDVLDAALLRACEQAA